MPLIRKVNIGKDYKDSMSFAVGQSAYGGHVVCEISKEGDDIVIYIEDEYGIKQWKSFNKNVGISIEYNIDY